MNNRNSADGWNIYNVLLELFEDWHAISFSTLLLDSYSIDDYTAMTAALSKLELGAVVVTISRVHGATL
jgi:hypothetical protein